MAKKSALREISVEECLADAKAVMHRFRAEHANDKPGPCGYGLCVADYGGSGDHCIKCGSLLWGVYGKRTSEIERGLG